MGPSAGLGPPVLPANPLLQAQKGVYLRPEPPQGGRSFQNRVDLQVVCLQGVTVVGDKEYGISYEPWLTQGILTVLFPLQRSASSKKRPSQPPLPPTATSLPPRGTMFLI